MKFPSPKFRQLLAVLTTLIAVIGASAAPAAASTSPIPLDTGAYAARVVELTNAERAKVGLAPLSGNPSLASAAQGYAGVLSQDVCFAHNCPPQPDLAKRLASAGYTFTGYHRWSWGENIAAGYPTPESVVAAWMASAGHRANILNANYRDLGVGLVYKPGSRYSYYWVQDFGARK